MRWTRLTLWLLVAVSLLAAAATLSCGTAQQTSTAPAALTAEEKVARGRYLSTVSGCNDCHTPGTLWGAPDTTRRLAGSELGWVGPWGVAYAANLTPDSTGLGTWTEEQIVHAIRTGNRPDGRQLAGIMPWMNFAHFTDEDAGAIAAYLKSLPPVVHRVPAPVPPGQKAEGSLVVFPPPSAWDAMNLPAAPSH